MEKIIKRDYFAIRILQKLMDRRNEPGYEEKAAIYEAYKLADLMVNLSGIPTYEDHKLNETAHNPLNTADTKGCAAD